MTADQIRRAIPMSNVRLLVREHQKIFGPFVYSDDGEDFPQYVGRLGWGDGAVSVYIEGDRVTLVSNNYSGLLAININDL